MSQDLLHYEFWETADIYYAKLFSRIPTDDLLAIRRGIAENTLAQFEPTHPLTWLDIGAGDGATFLEILKQVPNVHERKITLFAHEPSVKAASLLKKALEDFPNIHFEIIPGYFDPSSIAHTQFDIITALHSSYYLGETKLDFENLYTKLFASLHKNGVLLVQTIASNSDFRNLETEPYPYPLYSCGNYTKELFRELWNNADGKEFLTRFNVTQYLQKDLSEDIQAELRQFYLFIQQNPHLEFTQQIQDSFLEHVQKLATYSHATYYLDFKDWITWVKK